MKSGLKYCGQNVTIFPTAKIISPENIEVGDETVIDDFCFLYGVGKGIKLGRFNHICVHSIIQAGGRVEFGDFSALAPGCILMAATDDYHGNGFIGLKVLDKYRKTEFKDVIVGNHAHIGMGCIIQPGVTIGDGCSVGSGSLITKDLPPWTICYGSPCKPVKDKPREKQLEMEKRFLGEYAKTERKKSPLVSVCCLAYNHEKFIRQALDGFIMQKTNFKIEIIVHDDASTDGTVRILREYERRYPDTVRLILQKENQFSKTGIYPIFNLYKAAKGKYIAECDGDDWWTDPNKLQKQVDFMEANPDYSLCYHNYLITTKGKVTTPSSDLPKDYSELELIALTINGYGIATATRMFRNYYSEETAKDIEFMVGDYLTNAYLGTHGKCKFIPGIAPSYYRRLHGGNSWCSLPSDEMRRRTEIMYKKIYNFMVSKGNPEWIRLREPFLPKERLQVRPEIPRPAPIIEHKEERILPQPRVAPQPTQLRKMPPNWR